MSAQSPTLYPEDIFAAVVPRRATVAATDRFGPVVGRRAAGRVDHGDDGHGEVDPQHVGQRHAQGAHRHQRVPRAQAGCMGEFLA